MSVDKPRTVILPDPNARDWPAFWASLTDAEAATCLRAAPRVAGEWEENGNGFMRCDAANATNRLCYYWPSGYGGWVWINGRVGSGRCATPEEARAACDSALRASGWRVIG